jgi:hypothetical protein
VTVESLAVSRYLLPDWPGEKYTCELVWCGTGFGPGCGWKVLSATGLVLADNGVWEYESMPSARSQDFYERTRFADAEHALRAYMAARGAAMKAGAT